MSCPGSPSATHAKCELALTFSDACADVASEILLRISGTDGWQDPHNRGTYSVTASSASQIDGERVTGDGTNYLDKFKFMLAAGASGGCEVTACSESQSPSVLDYSTNYCNLKDLYCNRADGCAIVSFDLAYDEEITSCSYHYFGVSYPQHDFSQCLVDVAAQPTALPTTLPHPTPTVATQPAPRLSPAPTMRPIPSQTPVPSLAPTLPRTPPAAEEGNHAGQLAVGIILVVIALMYPLVGLLLQKKNALSRSRGFQFAQLRSDLQQQQQQQPS